MDTAFTGETSLTLERRSRRGAEAVRGGGGHRRGAESRPRSEWGSTYPGTGGTGGTGVSGDTLCGRERVQSQSGKG